MHEMDLGAQACKKFTGVKRQKVKVEEALGSLSEDEAAEVEHLLAEPKTENFLEDSILSFDGLELMNPIGQHDFEPGVLDGLLDEVEEVDDIHATVDISGACEDFLLDFELAEKSSNLYFAQSERMQPDKSSSESQSPGISEIDTGGLGLSESSTTTVPASGYMNSLEKTVQSDLRALSGRSECQDLTEDEVLFSHDPENPQEVHNDDGQPSGNCLSLEENNRKPLHSVMGKRKRRPTKRYIEELSATKMRLGKGSKKEYTVGTHVNGTVESLSHSTAFSVSKEESCCEGVTQSSQDIEVSLDEKSHAIVRIRNVSSAASHDKQLKIKYRDELHHRVELNIESREETFTGNDVQGPQQRQRGRPKKIAVQIHKSDDEWNESDSEDECMKRRKYKSRRSTCLNDRRKHQRTWTLSEVMKLVDGVAEYGTGRWTDIKNHMFSPSAYRTPIDLRDKWRNLLRASSSCRAMDEQAEEVKQGLKTGIPLSVLHRIGELATIHPYPRFSPGGRYIRRKN